MAPPYGYCYNAGGAELTLVELAKDKGHHALRWTLEVKEGVSCYCVLGGVYVMCSCNEPGTGPDEADPKHIPKQHICRRR